MTEFVKVANAADIEDGQRILVEVDDVIVAIFKVDGEFYCIEDVCTHDGGPVAEGALDGFEIECPRHGALFDIRDGRALTMPAVVPVPTYQVKVEGDEIFVESPDSW
jgi:3-phenylpropionate/trans-cinnamate dioxygenase ferredoxin subunit